MKALDNKIRFGIIVYLLIKQVSCLCELSVVFKIDASTLSYHISLIKDAKLVEIEKKGKSKIIRLSPDFYLLMPPQILADIEKHIKNIKKCFIRD